MRRDKRGDNVQASSFIQKPLTPHTLPLKIENSDGNLNFRIFEFWQFTLETHAVGDARETLC